MKCLRIQIVVVLPFEVKKKQSSQSGNPRVGDVKLAVGKTLRLQVNTCNRKCCLSFVDDNTKT